MQYVAINKYICAVTFLSLPIAHGSLNTFYATTTIFIVLEQCFLLLHSSLYTMDCNSVPNCVPAGQETAAPAAAGGGTVHTTSHQPRTSHRTLHEIIVYMHSKVRRGNA